MKYGKRPTVKRFRVQATVPGRMIRKATLERKSGNRKREERKARPSKVLRKR